MANGRGHGPAMAVVIAMVMAMAHARGRGLGHAPWPQPLPWSMALAMVLSNRMLNSVRTHILSVWTNIASRRHQAVSCKGILSLILPVLIPVLLFPGKVRCFPIGRVPERVTSNSQ